MEQVIICLSLNNQKIQNLLYVILNFTKVLKTVIKLENRIDKEKHLILNLNISLIHGTRSGCLV